MTDDALYHRVGDDYVGTILTQGAWDPGSQNGGAVLSLLGHCLEDVPTLVPMTVSRFTADLVRPVPIGQPMRVVPTILREGKKIQLVMLEVFVGSLEHVRATVLRLRDADLRGESHPPASTTDARPADLLVWPDRAVPLDDPDASRPGFLRGIELRRARFVESDGFGYWIRLRRPVVAGEPIRPTSRLTVGFDFANLIGVEMSDRSPTMINPDVTAHVLRPPVGEFIAVTGETRFELERGRGVSAATLSDEHGVFAFASTSQLVQPR